MPTNRRDQDARHSLDVKQIAKGFDQALVALMMISPVALALLFLSEAARANSEAIVIIAIGLTVIYAALRV